MKDAYSYPEYCDIAYDWGRAGECDFIETCAEKFSSGKGRRILDIACGTGIHLREFARRGYETCGIDSSPEMAEYVKKRSAAEELAADCRVSDMKGFILPGKYSFAICMLDSFRYMLTDEDISIHLGAVSESLDKGGIYFIDLWMPV
ncbi:MAG: class I SAM-dependent methyltransferase, partial [Candidatus Omnitrophota bacterium]